jgi:multiple sugar transport system substrate-binding protein
MIKVAKVAKVAAVALIVTAGAAQAADLTWMGSSYAEPANKPAVERMIAGFEASHGLAVEPLGFAWGDMQKNIFLKARSNTLPEVVQLQERWLPTVANLKGLVDLNTVYGKEKLEAAFAPEALALGNIDGHQWGLPLFSGTVGMVANKAVLEQAGVAVPKTVDEFKAALVAIRDKVPNSVPYPMATKNNGSIVLDFMIWNWVHGGQIIDESGKAVIDSEASRAALTFVVGLVKERLAAPEIDRPDSRRLTAQGQAGFYIDAPVTRTFLRDFSGKGEAFDANVLPMQMPVLNDGDKPVSVLWGHILSMFAPDAKAGGEDPASKFLTYATSDEVQTDFPISLSALPTTKSARAAVSSDAYLSNWAKAAGEPRANEVGIWSNAAELNQIVGEEVQAAMLEQKSVEDAITAMQTRLSESMRKAKPAN